LYAASSASVADIEPGTNWVVIAFASAA